MDKHTPGPWEILREFEGEKTITAIGPITSDGYGNTDWLKVSEEDALLAAAAPDLLEACREAELLLEDSLYQTQPYGRIAETITKITATIQKAEGGEK
jgi:hypothetical protein